MNRAASQAQGRTKANLSAAPGTLQRKCACGNHTNGSECEACSQKRLNLQRRAVDNRSEHTEVPSIVHEVLRSPGRPLDAETRAFMEPRFGHDFSHVRVHTDAKAAASALAVNALAYTVGRDVVFGSGQYAPATGVGQSLLAHELAHIIQLQVSSANTAGSLRIAELGTGWENEANEAADNIVSQRVASVKSRAEHSVLHRQLYSGPNVGPPVSELPKPPIYSCGIDKKGDLVCKVENLIPGDPELPLDPRRWSEKVKDALDPDSATREGLADCRAFPGFAAGRTSKFNGQCCKGDENTKNCCPPNRISFKEPFPRCCNANEDLKNGICVKKMESGEPELTLPPPEPLPVQDAPERTLPEGEEYA
jgi:Domain of unknown function (DUF4157)